MNTEEKLKIFLKKKSLLQTFDKYGRIYIPVEIRKKFEGYHFFIEEKDGRIYLIPLKI